MFKIIHTSEETGIPEHDTLLAALAYLLFPVSLALGFKSPFVRYHVNQGLILALACLVVYIAGYAIPVVGKMLIYPVGGLGVAALAVTGIICALRGDQRELPFIGCFSIIK